MKYTLNGDWEDKEDYPQDRINVTSTLSDKCPHCGGPLETSEGLERDYPDCPACRGEHREDK